MDKGFLKYQLDNGLTIFLKEIHSAPIVSQWIWYRVGSRNESLGLSGLSHWVEHMQFKGTNKTTGSAMERSIAREGGQWNAFTHMDWTAFYETLPANKVEISLRLEAERMHESVFDPNEVDFERTVILSEKEGKENDPFSRLNSAVTRAAFSFHPYRNDILGSEHDIKNISFHDLKTHYQKYYQPSNAILTLAGDFNSVEMIEKIRETYQNIENIPVLPINLTQESEILKSGEVIERGAGDTSFMQIAYRAPSAADSDFYVFIILDSLLSGPASLNMFGGGGISNKISRLYRNLVEKEYAVSVFGGLNATIDPFIYDLLITIHPDRKPETVLQAFDNEMARFLDHPVTYKEIKRAIKQASALFVYGMENITNQAFWLGYAEMFADYSWFTEYIDRIRSVRPADILRVAHKYLSPEKRITGLYLPEGSSRERNHDW